MSNASNEERFVCLRVPPLSGRTLNRWNGYTEGAENEEKMVISTSLSFPGQNYGKKKKKLQEEERQVPSDEKANNHRH